MSRKLFLFGGAACAVAFVSLQANANDIATAEAPSTIVIVTVEDAHGNDSDPKVYCVEAEAQVQDEASALATNKLIVEGDGVALRDQADGEVEVPAAVTEMFTKLDDEKIEEQTSLAMLDRRPNSWRHYRPTVGGGWYGYGYRPGYYGYRAGYRPPNYGYYWGNTLYPYRLSPYQYNRYPYRYSYYHHPRLH